MINNRFYRVLLVETDQEQYAVMHDLFTQFRSEVELTWVSNYYEALDAMSRCEQDVCLVDVHLADETGLNLLQEAAKLGCRAPVILLTEKGDHDIDLEAMRL